MRGKRSKQYKKLMNAYGHSFGFRAPYQVLLDSEIVVDAIKHKMDLVKGLERCLHGAVKPMITQCSIRHLYTLPTIDGKPNSSTTDATTSTPTLTQSQKSSTIDLAKTFERRRCNHHTLSDPLSDFSCIQSCLVSPSGENKHHYVVATQSRDLRAYLRSIPGVPLLYISRSVLIMEPMADISWERREKEEWGKFTIGLKDTEREAVEASIRGEAAERERKRKRGNGEGEEGGEGKEADTATVATTDGGGPAQPAMRRRKGPKGPNPLSVKKKKKVLPVKFLPHPTKTKNGIVESPAKKMKVAGEKREEKVGEDREKKRRKRKHGGSKQALKEGGENEAKVDTNIIASA